MMPSNIRKFRINGKTGRIVFCAVLYVLLVLFIIGLFVFGANYPPIYDSPEVKGGNADFAGVDIPSRDVACNLAGEWEFFYNKWIVTDGYADPDGMIDLPDVWTYKDFGSGALPKSGYASYRLYAENVQKDINVIVYRHYSNFAYRVFINGQLNYRSGTLSKNASETEITGRTAEQHPFVTDGSTLEIVIEVSASNTGGFNGAPWLASTKTGNSYGTNLRSFNYIALGITTAAVAISILLVLFFRYKRDLTTAAFMLALYAHFLSSKDMLYVIRWQITAAMIVEFLTAVITFIALVIHLRKNGAAFGKIPMIVTSSAGTVFAVLSLALYGTPLAPIFAFMLLAVFCAYLIPIVFSRTLTDVQRYVYSALFIFLMSVFGFELCDGFGLLVYGTEFIFTIELMLIVICFTVLWVWKMTKAARNAIRVSELERELSAVKSQALSAQIEPHFIFNSLTAIQARYRDGLNDGDKAIEQFSKYLRLVTDSKDEGLIPFDDEIRNVLNYFELENLRANGELNLYLDLNYTDFSVPVLSLQPLVENAIRHGGLLEKPDGYVQITSDKIDSAIVIKIIDNGKGFDVNTARKGVGTENTRKRFELLNADMQITSSSHCGTTVTITIPTEQI